MNRELLKEQIKRHEGEVLEIYKDSLGYLTFGVGMKYDKYLLNMSYIYGKEDNPLSNTIRLTINLEI